MKDLIERQAAIDALNEYFVRIGKLKRRGLNKGEKAIRLDTVGAINSLPPAQPDNKINLCDSCKHTFPACPARSTDVIWGNGTWNDNICVCSKYEPSSQLHGTCKTCIMGSICKFRAGLGDNGYCSQWKAEESEQDG